MKIERVEEILHSSDIIRVFHKGSSIWIRKINGDYVEIKDIFSDKISNVPSDELKEMH